MCLAIPMQIESIEGYIARCNANGVERDVNLFMLQDDQVNIGDFVMVHVGYAIEKLRPEEARKRHELFAQMNSQDGE